MWLSLVTYCHVIVMWQSKQELVLFALILQHIPAEDEGHGDQKASLLLPPPSEHSFIPFMASLLLAEPPEMATPTAPAPSPPPPRECLRTTRMKVCSVVTHDVQPTHVAVCIWIVILIWLLIPLSLPHIIYITLSKLLCFCYQYNFCYFVAHGCRLNMAPTGCNLWKDRCTDDR